MGSNGTTASLQALMLDAYSQGIMIDMTGAPGNSRSVTYDVNTGWSWHFTGDVALAELSIELCDGRPSMVEADLGYWLRTVGSFCPWGSYVYAELP